MKIAIINGPNLNLLGQRENSIYGNRSFDDFFINLKLEYSDIEFIYFQSNVEGELINFLQIVSTEVDGIIINPGGYTHTSVAIGDCIAALKLPVLEVHISNIFAREDFRKVSHVSAKCRGTISGLGLEGYCLAVSWIKKQDFNK
ncbi:MAG: type II 3-dehydroquinate dehydratase [Alphaproteobacteria bacterium]|nr:type II 3-dehydroquinate dehydratase [Alphaproteobacteria bacterium]